MPCRDLLRDVVAVVSAVASEGGDAAHPFEQQADLPTVIRIRTGQLRHDDPAGVGVRGEVQLPPRPAPLAAVLLAEPFAWPTQPQAGAVHQQVHGPFPPHGRGISSFSALRLIVEWSGTARSRPSNSRIEVISPSVWRSASRNTARKVSAVEIAGSE
jgi:hypothetical protein